MTLLGPGYGESIVMHLGDGKWVIVDSFLDLSRTPAALRYLSEIGVDPARDVVLVVATHWHDEYIRGMAAIIRHCGNARFCCSAAFCSNEFLALVGRAAEQDAVVSSGLRELHDVFSHLDERGTQPIHALAGRCVLPTDSCDIWTLSPGDAVFRRFLESVGGMLLPRHKGRDRTTRLTPNQVAVALWVDAGAFHLLLGADLDRAGWKQIGSGVGLPKGRASAFKVPHHGAANADDPAVWQRLLEAEPSVVLTPWRRGGRVLPTALDAERILRASSKAWITSKARPAAGRSRREAGLAMVARERMAGVRQLHAVRDAVRLRRRIGSGTHWRTDLYGDACHLRDYAA